MCQECDGCRPLEGESKFGSVGVWNSESCRLRCSNYGKLCDGYDKCDHPLPGQPGRAGRPYDLKSVNAEYGEPGYI